MSDTPKETRAIERLFVYLKHKKITPRSVEQDLSLYNGMLSKVLNNDNSTLKESVQIKVISHFKDLNPLWLAFGMGEMINEENSLDTQNYSNLNTNLNSNLSENNTNLAEGKEIIVFKGKAIEKQQLNPVPVYNVTATLGLPTIYNDNAHIQPIGFVSVPNLPKTDCFIYAEGESMQPIVCNGDMIAIKKVNNRDFLLWGEMYLIVFDLGNDLRNAVKKVMPSEKEQHIKLVSYNRVDFPDMDIPKEYIIEIYSIKAVIRVNAY